MNKERFLLANTLAVLLFGTPGSCLPAGSTPSVESKSGAWIEKNLDLVIKDRRGRPVRNLSPGDLRILDDGKPVQITSLKIAGNLVGPSGDGGPLRFVSFLLNGDSDLSRSLASDASIELSKTPNHSTIYVAVWEIRNRFILLHNFDNDLGSVRAALGKRQKSTSIADSRAADKDGQEAVVAARQTAKTILEMHKRLTQQQHLRLTTAALLALTRGEKPVPGRKMLLFFSDATQLSTATNEAINLIVSEANNSEVSFYDADISGVNQKAAQRATQALVDSARMGVTAIQATQYANSAGVLSSKEFMPDGTASGQSRLRTLSLETGGAYTDASNGVRKFARAALADTAAFYEASYRQPIGQTDVHFRTIAVRANRRGLQIQSRAGGFPSLLLGGKELSGFEVPLVSALSTSSRAETIWFSGEAFPGPPPAAAQLTNVVVQVPLSGLMAHELDQTRRFRFRASILALLKDRDGQIVDKVSRDVTLEGALEALSRARADTYTFTSAFSVAPAGCHVDIAIRDEFASKISTKTIECSSSLPAKQLVSAANRTPDGSRVNAGGATSLFVETDGADSETTSINALLDPKLLKNTSRPSDTQIEALISGAKERVLDYKRALPNFVCMRVTRRSIDPTGRGVWKASDSSSSLLAYIGGKETTVRLDVDGHPADNEAALEDDGANVRGEFGEFLAMPFADNGSSKPEWEGEAELMGNKTQVFRFSIPRAHSTYLFQQNGGGQAIFTAYHALLYIDADTLGVRRVTVVAEGLPKDSFIRECQLSVDYDYIPVGGSEYLLPVHASLFVQRHARTLHRNEIEFQNYRKYGAESKLVAAH